MKGSIFFLESVIFYILGKFSVCGGAPTINAKNFSSLAFLLGHKRSLCPFLNCLSVGDSNEKSTFLSENSSCKGKYRVLNWYYSYKNE